MFFAGDRVVQTERLLGLGNADSHLASSDSLFEPRGFNVTQRHISIIITVVSTPGIVRDQRIRWTEMEALLVAVGQKMAQSGYKASRFLYKRTARGPWLGWVNVCGVGSWG